MSSPIRRVEGSPEELMGTRNIYLKRIREEEEARTEQKENSSSTDPAKHDEAVLNAKLTYLEFLHERGMSQEEQDFLRLPINNDAKKAWEEEDSKAAAA